MLAVPIRAGDHVVAVGQGGDGIADEVPGVGADEAVAGIDRAREAGRPVGSRHRPALTVPWAADDVVAVGQGGDAVKETHHVARVVADEAVGGIDGTADAGGAVPPCRRPTALVPVRTEHDVVAVGQRHDRLTDEVGVGAWRSSTRTAGDKRILPQLIAGGAAHQAPQQGAGLPLEQVDRARIGRGEIVVRVRHDHIPVAHRGEAEAEGARPRGVWVHETEPLSSAAPARRARSANDDDIPTPQSYAPTRRRPAERLLATAAEKPSGPPAVDRHLPAVRPVRGGDSRRRGDVGAADIDPHGTAGGGRAVGAEAAALIEKIPSAAPTSACAAAPGLRYTLAGSALVGHTAAASAPARSARSSEATSAGATWGTVRASIPARRRLKPPKKRLPGGKRSSRISHQGRHSSWRAGTTCGACSPC